MKKYFITGLVILLPVTVTLIILVFIFNLLTEPFLELSKAILWHSNLLDNGVLFLSAGQLQNFLTQALILAVLFVFTVSLGFIARWFFINYMIHFWELLIQKIPLVSTIYTTCQDMIKTIFASDTSAFKQVVMVRFPHPQAYTIGLLTRDTLPGLEHLGEEMVAVFVPTTPNPTCGFLTLFRKADVVPLDMKVEDAFKYVISCGVIMAPINRDAFCDPVMLTKPENVQA